MALIILDQVRVIRNETDGLLYFAATYKLTEVIGGTDSGEFFVPVGTMADSEVTAALQSAAATHANIGTGGSFVPADVRLGAMTGGLSANGAATLLGAETDGFAIDFIDLTMVIKDVATPANVYSGLPTSKLTFTRASTAYYLASTGILTLAGINEARYDHHPTTLLPRGLLLEEARTNLCLQSEALGTTWTASNVTVASNTGLGMRGTTTADKLTATAADGTVTQAITATAIPYTFSVWLRRVTGTGNIDISADGTTWVTVNITTTLTRFETTLTLTATVYNPGIRIVTSGDEVDAWGGQFEAGGYASSYIQTTTIAVTRSADNCTLAGTLFPLSQTAGTFICEVEYAGVVRGSGAAAAVGSITVGDGTSTEIASVQVDNGTGSSRCFVLDGGVSQANIAISGVVINTVYKVGEVYAAGDFHLARDGVLASSPDSAGTLPTTTGIYFGSTTGASNNTAWFRSVLYLPRRVTNAELQALTT